MELEIPEPLTPDVIRRLVERYGLTREQFAEKFGLSLASLDSLESGEEE